MERVKNVNGDLMKYSMSRLDAAKNWELTLFRYDEIANGKADNAHREFWHEIEGLREKFADAQATIAALQARVRTATQLIIAEIGVSGPEDLEEAVGRIVGRLQQRTAECEALKLVNDTHMKTVMKLSHVVEQRTAELEAAKRERDVWYARYNELSGVKDRQLNNLQAELERVRGLVKALPKVEGEIVAQAGYVKDRKKVYACFGSVADMTAYAAIVQHRQGMEG